MPNMARFMSFLIFVTKVCLNCAAHGFDAATYYSVGCNDECI